MKTKICTKCKVEKPLDEFHNRKDSKDGKKSRCKDCRSDDSVIYREDNKELISEKSKVYYKNNKKLINNRNTKWHSNNKEYHNELIKKWFKNNPDKKREYKFERRGWGTPIILNEYFENSHCHHLQSINSETGEIDHRTCLYVPIELHTSVHHDNTNRKTMLAINELVFEWLLTQV